VIATVDVKVEDLILLLRDIQSHDSKLPFYILTLFLRNQCVAITLTDRPRIEIEF